MNLKNRILAFLSSEEGTEETVVNLAEEKLEDGTIIIADIFEAGASIFIKGEEENVKLPVGEYKLEGGSVLIVTEEGIIESYGEAEADEPKEDEPKEEAIEQELAEEPMEEPQDESNEPEVDGQIQELIIVIASLEERIAKLEGGEELTTEEVVEELSAEEVIVEEVQLSNEESKEDEPEPIVHVPVDKTEKKSAFYFGKN